MLLVANEAAIDLTGLIQCCPEQKARPPALVIESWRLLRCVGIHAHESLAALGYDPIPQRVGPLDPVAGACEADPIINLGIGECPSAGAVLGQALGERTTWGRYDQHERFAQEERLRQGREVSVPARHGTTSKISSTEINR